MDFLLKKGQIQIAGFTLADTDIILQISWLLIG
jgi:hypothetical protein